MIDFVDGLNLIVDLIYANYLSLQIAEDCKYNAVDFFHDYSKVLNHLIFALYDCSLHWNRKIVVLNGVNDGMNAYDVLNHDYC